MCPLGHHYACDVSRIFGTSFASVYPHYVTKVERKGRTKADLDQVIGWLTGFDESELSGHLAAGTTFEDFFADARLNPHASSIGEDPASENSWPRRSARGSGATRRAVEHGGPILQQLKSSLERTAVDEV